MSTAVSVESRIANVVVTDEAIIAHLLDGRVISVPLAWSWRLSDATPEQRLNWQLIGDGLGIHWPDVDEDISAGGMLRGIPAHRPRRPGVTPPADTPRKPATAAKRRAKAKRRTRAARG